MEYQAKKPGVTFSQVSTAYVVILGVDHPDVYSYQFINSLCLQMPPCFPSTAPQTSPESSNPWPNGGPPDTAPAPGQMSVLVNALQVIKYFENYPIQVYIES